MKNVFRIIIVLTFLLMIFYFSKDHQTSKPLQGNINDHIAIPQTEIDETIGLSIPRPEDGLSVYIGQSAADITKQFGAPTRIDLSNYAYDWWVYTINEQLLMFGVENEVVVQVYTNSFQLNVAPYYIGESLDDIYRKTIVEQEISITIGESIYLFAMNDLDLKTRILVGFDGVLAQLYIDTSSNTLAGIRYINGETLVKHKAYELQYIGELMQEEIPSSYVQMEINEASALQLNDLINTFRVQRELPKLSRSPIVSGIAAAHSEFLTKQHSQTDVAEGFSIKERLNEYELEFESVAYNDAINYTDAIEVVHGWLNSKTHAAALYDERYNFSGTGVYLNNYTQIYMERKTLD